ncbi:MAG: glycosyltransferase [archaeon]
MISFIIPYYNSYVTLIKTLDSIYSCKIKKYFEVIIVDDGSTDGSVLKIKKLYPRTIIVRQAHSGGAKARNTGIKRAKYEKLFFMDSDVSIDEGSFKKIIGALTANHDIAFPQIIYEDGMIMYPAKLSEERYPGISACFAINKSSLAKLDGLFDEYYNTYLEDYDFFARCKLAGLTAEYVKYAVAVHLLKSERDFTSRFYLEFKNLVYGYIKFSKYPEKLYNPFTPFNIFKASICSLFNFAWFNWQGYPRTSSIGKLRVIILRKNKISNNWFALQSTFFKAAATLISDRKKIMRKKQKFSRWCQGIC